MNLRITPVVLNLLIANVAVFLVWQLFSDQGWVWEYFLLWKVDLVFHRPEPLDFSMVEHPSMGWGHFLPIQVITSMFSHQALWHLFFNMYALISFGPVLEMVMGPRRFLSFYLFCGLFGTTMTAFFDPTPNPVLGASGALFGVMVAFAYYFPDTRLGIMFLPFQFKIRPFMYVTCALSAIFVAGDFLGYPIGGSISHFGHLAGAVGAVIMLFGNRLVGGARR